MEKQKHITTHRKHSTTYIRTILMAAIAPAMAIALFIGCLAYTGTASAATPALKVRSKSLYINGTYTIPLKNKIKKATYFYTSSKTKVAKVNSKGKITARGKGSAKIKVRYKYKRKTRTIGTFKVTVRKTAMRSDVKTIRTTVGTTLTASSYLNDRNPSATYSIISTSAGIVDAGSNGSITIKKAGSTTLTIVEKYNGKSRSLGRFSLIATGASLSTDTIKMAFDSSYDIDTILADKVAGASYTFSTSNPLLVQISGSKLIAASSPGYDTTCIVNAYETIGDNTRTIGSIHVNLIQSAYIAPENRKITVGLGTVLNISDDCIKLMNRDPNAVYTIKAEDPNVIDETGKTIQYGTTNISVTETKGSDSTVLSETVAVTVTSASMKRELLSGLDLRIGGSNYADYPVIYPNLTVNYYYTSSNTKICQTGTGTDADYLMLYPKNPGKATITIYEVSKDNTSQRKVGEFEVRIAKDNGEIENADNLMAADILSACSLYHKGKTFQAIISEDSRECTFVDKEGNGVLDYGMDYSTLTSGNFTVSPVRNRFLLDRIEADEDDPAHWIAYIDLQNGTAEQETDIIPINITLESAPLDAGSIFASIQIKLGSSKGIIDRKTGFPDDPETLQFADENVSFVYDFTAKQYIAAGATEYNDDAEDPKSLSELTNVFCIPMPNVWSAKNPTASTTVKSISEAETSDNSYWTFTVTFDNEETVDFDVTLGLKE